MTEKYLITILEAPYGNERPVNALRLALSLASRADTQVRVYLSIDGVYCARKGQKTPPGYPNIEQMLKVLMSKGQVAT
jgi:uncharacterized protein involved in oxidation of intracellular sulfur